MTMEDLRVKLLYTAVVYFLFLQLALRYGICGATLADLKENMGVNTDSISKSVSVMCLGICIGAISSGFLCKYICRELLAFFLVLATSLLVASYAFLKNYGIFLAWNLIVGMTSGASISLCESWILEIWGKQCGPYMQALQFFRGLGYIISPILSAPFLSSKEDEEKVSFNNSTLSLDTHGTLPYSSINTTALDPEPKYNTKIRTPFILNAIMLGVGAVFLICFYIFKQISKNRTGDLGQGMSQIEIVSNSMNSIADAKTNYEPDMSKTIPEETINKRAKYFGFGIVLLSSVFYLFFYEEVIVIFLPTYATNVGVHLTKGEASLLTTAFSLSNVIGKAISVVLALKISHIKLLYGNLLLMIGSLVVIIVFGNSSVLLLWIGICIHGVGLSSVIASLYTLMESTIEMSPQICGILNMMGTLGSVFLPLIIGNHLDQHPMMLMYACLTCAIGCLILYIVMHVLLINKNKLVAVPVCEKFECSNSKVNKF